MRSLPTCEKSSLLFQRRWTRGDSGTKFSLLSVIALKPQSRWGICVVIEKGCAVLDGLPRVCVVVCVAGALSAVCCVWAAGCRQIRAKTSGSVSSKARATLSVCGSCSRCLRDVHGRAKRECMAGRKCIAAMPATRACLT